MLDELSIYKILSKFKNIHFLTQELLIFGLGFPSSTYIRNDEYGNLIFTPCNDVETVLFSWISHEDDIIEIQTKSSVSLAKYQFEALNQITDDCIVRKRSLNALSRITITWSSENEYTILNVPNKSSNIIPVAIRSDVELLRQIINKYVKRKCLRLKYIEIDFILQNKKRLLHSVKKWKFSENESLRRFHQISLSKCVSPASRQILSPRTAVGSHVPTPIPNNIGSPKANPRQKHHIGQIERKIADFVKKSPSAKYINFSIWKKKVDNGSALLPNEQLFGKILAKQYKSAKEFDSVKEVKNLAIKMSINLDSNKGKRHLQEALRQEILFHWPFNQGSSEEVKTTKIEAKKKRMDEKKNLNRILEDTIEEFDKIQGKIKTIKSQENLGKM